MSIRKKNSYAWLLPMVVFSVVTSCMTAKKVDKWIDKHYDGSIADKEKKSDYVTFIISDSLENRVSSTTRTQKSMLPLLLYWQWHYAVTSCITARAPLNNFSSSFLSYANTKGLKGRLNGRVLELTVHTNPANFSLHDRGYLVFLLVFYFSGETIYISPESDTFSVAYRVLDGAQEIKSGVVSVPNINKEVTLKILQSTKKMLWKHLEACDQNMQKMSRELVDELIYQLP